MWSTVRKEEKLDTFRPSEMIQRKPEKKSLERHKVDLPGKKDKKCDGNDPERQQNAQNRYTVHMRKERRQHQDTEKPLENKREGDRG